MEKSQRQTCRELLQELKSNDAYHKMSTVMCVRMIELVVMTHDWCLSGKCSSSNTKEQLVDKIYTCKHGPLGKRRGEEHFELLEKMVPDLIHRCLELRKSGGESRQDDLDLKRKRFLIEEDENMEPELASSPVLLSKKQALPVNKVGGNGTSSDHEMSQTGFPSKLL